MRDTPLNACKQLSFLNKNVLLVSYKDSFFGSAVGETMQSVKLECWVSFWQILGEMCDFRFPFLSVDFLCLCGVRRNILRDPNKLHFVGSIIISLLGKSRPRVWKNYLLIQQNAENVWNWGKNNIIFIFEIVFFNNSLSPKSTKWLNLTIKKVNILKKFINVSIMFHSGHFF